MQNKVETGQTLMTFKLQRHASDHVRSNSAAQSPDDPDGFMLHVDFDVTPREDIKQCIRSWNIWFAEVFVCGN